MEPLKGSSFVLGVVAWGAIAGAAIVFVTTVEMPSHDSTLSARSNAPPVQRPLTESAPSEADHSARSDAVKRERELRELEDRLALALVELKALRRRETRSSDDGSTTDEGDIESRLSAVIAFLTESDEIDAEEVVPERDPPSPPLDTSAVSAAVDALRKELSGLELELDLARQLLAQQEEEKTRLQELLRAFEQGDGEVDGLLQQLDEERSVRLAASAALFELGEEAVPILLEAAEDDREVVQEWARALLESLQPDSEGGDRSTEELLADERGK